MSLPSNTNTSRSPLPPPSLFPVVYDLSDMEYSDKYRRGSNSSFSSSSGGLVEQAACYCSDHHPSALEFTFADLHHLVSTANTSATDDTNFSAPQSPPTTISPLTQATDESRQDQDDGEAETEILPFVYSRDEFVGDGGDTCHHGTKTLPPRTQDARQDHLLMTKPSFSEAATESPRSWRGAAASLLCKKSRQFSHQDQNNDNSKSSGSFGVLEYDDGVDRFDDLYCLKRKIAHEKLSILWECECRLTGKMFLVKTFPCDGEAGWTRAKHELNVLKRIQDGCDGGSCANLADLVHVFSEDDAVHVVLDSKLSKDPVTLQSLVLRHGCLPEPTVKTIVRDVLHALDHLHKLGVGYVLQPSSVLVDFSAASIHSQSATTYREANSAPTSLTGRAVLVDFAATAIHSQEATDETDQQKHKQGPANRRNCMISLDALPHVVYAAPEVLRPTTNASASLLGFHPNEEEEPLCSICGSYWGVSDVWSVGVMMQHCFLGHVPASTEHNLSQSPRVMFADSRQRRRGHHLHRSESAIQLGGQQTPQQKQLLLPLHNSNNMPISRQARQFMGACLHQDSTIRMTVRESLEHIWLQQNKQEEPIPCKSEEESSPPNQPPKQASSESERTEDKKNQRSRRQWWATALRRKRKTSRPRQSSLVDTGTSTK